MCMCEWKWNLIQHFQSHQNAGDFEMYLQNLISTFIRAIKKGLHLVYGSNAFLDSLGVGLVNQVPEQDTYFKRKCNRCSN